MNRVPDSNAGSCSGSGMQQIGGSIAIAIAVSVYAAGAVNDQFVPASPSGLLTAGGLAALATLVATVSIGRGTPCRDAGTLTTSGTEVDDHG